MKYQSNALAQEKTGKAWTAQRVLGGGWHGDFEHCDVAVIVGKIRGNPTACSAHAS